MRFSRRGDRLERRLEAERPQPTDEFVSRLARRISAEPVRPRAGWRVALAGGFTALLAVAFALTGGISYAASAIQGGTDAVTSLVVGPSHVNNPTPANKPEQAGQGNPENSNKGGKPSSQPSDSSPQVVAQAQEDKVTICHVPPGNPENPQTITVGASAVPFHLEEHEGDAIGPCPEDPTPPDDQYEDKVLICHIPPGNEGNPITIRVSENAVPAHLAHGDSLGPCA